MGLVSTELKRQAALDAGADLGAAVGCGLELIWGVRLLRVGRGFDVVYDSVGIGASR